MSEPSEVIPLHHVAWCRYTERSIVTCDSDAIGAFRVYRQTQWKSGDGDFPADHESVIGWGRLAGDVNDDCHEVYRVGDTWYSVRGVDVVSVSHWMPFPCGPCPA